MNEQPNPGGPGRVLVAEDDELFRRSMTALLRHAGYDCQAAASADDALAALGAGAFDVLIADINMPGNKRLELIEAMPRVAPGLPAILLTGLPTVESAARSVRLPVYAYLVKPPDPEELLGLIRQAAEEHRQRRLVRTSRARLQSLESELAGIEASLGRVAGVDETSPMTEFLRVTLRNIAASIIELERSVATPGLPGGPGRPLQTAELLAALRRTVGVLEKTRQNFKSKDLGQLRHELEDLLGRHLS